MATASKTTKKSTSTKTAKPTTTKTAKSIPKSTPAKAAKTTKPTPATKPKAVKSAEPNPPDHKKNIAKPIFIAIIIIAILAIVAGFAVCLINKYVINNDIVMIEDGAGNELKAKRTGLEGYNYTIAVPTDFETMSTEKVEAVYGTTATPGLVFANSDESVNIVFVKPNSNLKDDQIKDYTEAMELILSTSADVISSNTYEVDGHNVGTIRVITDTDDEKSYNQMLFFSYDNQLAIINFNCKADLQKDWEVTGENILKTLKFSE